jgi:hypothetical protein
MKKLLFLCVLLSSTAIFGMNKYTVEDLLGAAKNSENKEAIFGLISALPEGEVRNKAIKTYNMSKFGKQNTYVAPKTDGDVFPKDADTPVKKLAFIGDNLVPAALNAVNDATAAKNFASAVSDAAGKIKQ